jgi:hypothetical protein
VVVRSAGEEGNVIWQFVIGVAAAFAAYMLVRRVVGGKRTRAVGEVRTVVARPLAGRTDRRGRGGRL